MRLCDKDVSPVPPPITLHHPLPARDNAHAAQLSHVSAEASRALAEAQQALHDLAAASVPREEHERLVTSTLPRSEHVAALAKAEAVRAGDLGAAAGAAAVAAGMASAEAAALRQELAAMNVKVASAAAVVFASSLNEVALDTVVLFWTQIKPILSAALLTLPANQRELLRVDMTKMEFQAASMPLLLVLHKSYLDASSMPVIRGRLSKIVDILWRSGQQCIQLKALLQS